MRIDRIIKLVSIAILVLLGFSCKKIETHKDVDYNSIPAVIADNYNLSIFSKSLEMTKTDLLLQDATVPYTVIVPSNDAFNLIDITTPIELIQKSYSWVERMAKYHIIPGKINFKQFPFLINQVVPTADGKKLYVSKWLRGRDSVLTINGADVLLEDVPSSTGLIQIVNRVMTSYEHEKISETLKSVEQISLFSEMVRRSDLLTDLSGNTEYTIFAPTNEAVVQAGYTSLEKILETDKSELRNFCMYHISLGRRFLNDYIFSIGESNKGFQRMINNQNINVRLIPDPQNQSRFTGIEVAQLINPKYYKIVERDLLAGNGIIHIIDGVLASK